MECLRRFLCSDDGCMMGKQRRQMGEGRGVEKRTNERIGRRNEGESESKNGRNRKLEIGAFMEEEVIEN